ncbi:MAG: YfhO family protein [Lachnospiraceae bacterium]|nr:YfhO family protein [Lachnospiraceae bacterium]
MPIVEKNKNEYGYPLVLAILVIISSIAGFSLAHRFPEGAHIFMSGDYYVQYIQFIRLFWRTLFEGKGLSYSFNVSMGHPTAALYAYYCLSPCNIWVAIISDADTAAYLILLSKQLLIAISFYFFSRKVLRANEVSAMLAALMYAQCGYLVSTYWHINLIDALYLLVIIVWMLVRFVCFGHWKGLCLAYAASFVICFYSGYQLGIFSVLVFVLLMIYYRHTISSVWKKRMLAYVGSVLLAMLLSAFVTMPAFGGILLCESEGTPVFLAGETRPWDFFAGFFWGVDYGIRGHVPMSYCGTVAIVLLVFFVMDKGTKRIRRIFWWPLVCFLIICVFVKWAYLFMHAFNIPDGNAFRFSYMFSFLLCSITAYQFSRLQYFFKSLTGVCICAGASALYMLCMLLQNSENSGDVMNITGLLVNALFMFAMVFTFQGVKGSRFRAAHFFLVFLIMLESITNVFFARIRGADTEDRSLAYYRLWNEQGERTIRLAKEFHGNDDGFYRIHYENAFSANNAAFWGYNGLGSFISMENVALRHFLMRLGYQGRVAELDDYGATELTQALFAQKYRAHGTNMIVEGAESYVFEKKDIVLPLAFFVDESLRTFSASDGNPFQNQNGLLSAMLGEDITIFFPPEGVEMQEDNLIYEDNGNEKSWHLAGDSKGYGSVILSIPAKMSRAYVYFSQDEEKPIEGTARVFTGIDGGLPTLFSFLNLPHILEMIPGDAGTFDVGIMIDPGTVSEASFKDVYFRYLDEQAMNEALCRLREGGVELTEIRGTRLLGKTNGNGGLLFTSVPYDKGWRVYVDGEKTECFAVCDGAFLAVEIPTGEHTLEFRYTDKWVTCGICMSAVGALVFVMALYMTKKNRK